MSESLTDIAKDVSSIATSVTPFIGVADDAAKVVGAVATDLTGVINNAVAQKYNKEAQEKAAAYDNLLASGSCTASDLDNLLCNYAGQAECILAPGMEGEPVFSQSRVAYINLLIQLLIERAASIQNASAPKSPSLTVSPAK